MQGKNNFSLVKNWKILFALWPMVDSSQLFNKIKANLSIRFFLNMSIYINSLSYIGTFRNNNN